MKKIIILTSVLFISTIMVAVFYFSSLSVETRDNDKIMAHIPREAALVFQFKNDLTFNNIFKDYELFNTVLGEQKIAEFTQLQLLLARQSQFIEATDNQNIFLSFYPNATDSVDMLWTMALNKQISVDDIYKLLLLPSNDLAAKVITVSRQNVLEVFLKPLNRIFYLFIDEGLAVGSFSKYLIQKSLDNNTPKISREFIAEINASGQKNENSPFNIFVNHTSAYPFSKKFLRNKSDGNFSLLKQLGGFSILNMNFKSDAFMFNGISKVDTGSHNYLNLFLHQKPVYTTIKKVFSENTSNFMAFGISNYTLFHSNLCQLLKKRNELSKLTDQIKHIEEKYDINLENSLTKLWGNEFAVLQLSSNEHSAILNVKNGQEMDFLLRSISSEYSENVRKFNDSNLLYYYFGDPLKLFSRPYFAIIDNYLFIANDEITVQRMFDDYINDRLLYKSAEFSEFNQLVANQSNIMFFIQNKNSSYILKNTLRQSYAGLFTGENSGFKKFYGLSYQWSADGDHFFINLYASYVSAGTNNSDLVWKYRLSERLPMSNQANLNNPNGMMLYNYDFRVNTVIQPHFFSLNQSVYQTGVSRGEDNLLYLFNDGGRLEGFPVNVVSGFRQAIL